ncbi:TetR/AcrR family transcriptional regulator [uncultured Bifidobacterium sp.]|uniref:TetR/AcrR family transcriptional regulator n=1 Tax=uncultured Bifidobacterium sp. TaxID=165187 RepID=UPI0026191397|nr:TetR/AcrR family transcriptional regulator [uncultured Bifidobacterium sp.]
MSATTARERTREETDRKILQTMLEIAASRGVGAITIEEVARRSGVAKTTIYRRYRNSDDMLHKIGTLEMAGSQDLANLDPSRDSLRLLLERVRERFTTGIGIKAVSVLLSSNSTYFSGIIDQAIVPELRHFSDFIARGQKSGIFRMGLHPKFLFGTIIGSMVAMQALAEGTPDNDSWSERMTALLWPAITDQPSERPARGSLGSVEAPIG